MALMHFNIGDKVACTNSSLRGVVVKILDKKNVLLRDDDSGMELDYPTKTLVLIEAGHQQHTAKQAPTKDAPNTAKNTLTTVDLHTEKLPSAYKTTPALQGQLDYFDYKMALAIQQGIKKITIIHGRGSGVLGREVIKRLRSLPSVKNFYDPEKILSLKNSKLCVELR